MPGKVASKSVRLGHEQTQNLEFCFMYLIVKTVKSLTLTLQKDTLIYIFIVLFYLLKRF